MVEVEVEVIEVEVMVESRESRNGRESKSRS